MVCQTRAWSQAATGKYTPPITFYYQISLDLTLLFWDVYQFCFYDMICLPHKHTVTIMTRAPTTTPPQLSRRTPCSPILQHVSRKRITPLLHFPLYLSRFCSLSFSSISYISRLKDRYAPLDWVYFAHPTSTVEVEVAEAISSMHFKGRTKYPVEALRLRYLDSQPLLLRCQRWFSKKGLLIIWEAKILMCKVSPK